MQMDGRMLQCFTVPWMNPADINVTPDWVNETVWYQIFPDRFCRGADTKEEAGVTKWRTGTVTNEERFGGKFKWNPGKKFLIWKGSESREST